MNIKCSESYYNDILVKQWRTYEGILHREAGPAVTHSTGYAEWYQNGLLHRTNGPAITFTDGAVEYWNSGLLHRTDGPAQEWSDGSINWYINGIHLTDKINIWMTENNISYPFSKQELLMFQLTWC